MNDLRGDNIIDSRDILKRIAELEDERSYALEQYVDEAREEWKDAHNGCWKDFDEDVARADFEWDDDSETELSQLTQFQEEVGSSEFKHGLTLIKDEHFEDYAKEYAKDTGEYNGGENWPFNHIDWEAAANALKEDFSAAEFGGDTYWYQG